MCRAYATNMTSVHLSVYVCLSVTLVDCDHIMQQKVEMGHDWIDRCLGYLHAEANRLVSSCDPELYGGRTVAYRKNVEFCAWTASNGSHVALSQHLLNFTVFNLKCDMGHLAFTEKPTQL